MVERFTHGSLFLPVLLFDKNNEAQQWRISLDGAHSKAKLWLFDVVFFYRPLFFSSGVPEYV
jgi:hypothetical protein